MYHVTGFVAVNLSASSTKSSRHAKLLRFANTACRIPGQWSASLCDKEAEVAACAHSRPKEPWRRLRWLSSVRTLVDAVTSLKARASISNFGLSRSSRTSVAGIQ